MNDKIEELKKEWYKLSDEKRDLMEELMSKDEKIMEISASIINLTLKKIQTEAEKRIEDSVNKEMKDTK